MRIPVIILLLSAFCLTTNAQVKFGVKAPIDIAHQSNALYTNAFNPTRIVPIDSKNRTGFSGGIFADLPISKAFVCRPQLLYTIGGGKNPVITDYNGNAIAGNYSYSMRYIMLPVQFLYSPVLPVGRPWIGLGPYGGYLTGGTAKWQTGNPFQPVGSSPLKVGSDASNDFVRFDFGLSYTAGFTFRNGILVGADLQQGLSQVTPSKTMNGAPRIKTKNIIWGLYAGYECKLP